MKKGIKTKHTKRDISIINKAFYNKVEEYSKLSLDELKELFPTLGGTYRIACLHVTEQKLQEQKEANLKEAIDEIKQIQDAEIIDEPNIQTNE